MPSATFELVRRAIAEKKQLRGVYEGHEREMCPHVLGFSRDGDEVALCYQFGGGSTSGLEPDGSTVNWRCTYLAKFEGALIGEGEWHSALTMAGMHKCAWLSSGSGAAIARGAILEAKRLQEASICP